MTDTMTRFSEVTLKHLAALEEAMEAQAREIEEFLEAKAEDMRNLRRQFNQLTEAVLNSGSAPLCDKGTPDHRCHRAGTNVVGDARYCLAHAKQLHDMLCAQEAEDVVNSET